MTVQRLMGPKWSELNRSTHILIHTTNWLMNLDKKRKNMLLMKSNPLILISQRNRRFLLDFRQFHQLPLFIEKFLNSYDLTDKNIISFTTSTSSTIKENFSFMQQICAAISAQQLPGFTVNTTDEIADYLTQNSYIK
ncbi:hypothetical protein FD14_GL002016 [Secundilactobacillus similis DSM 23365 = JCM 2765]|uniref:Flavodoxin-like domain-containing protein n=3 Tax=Secundilactobacillus similis TaxID=414682 RepID=A0A0R2EQ75_9LACO|nr:hypothetical protein FD14_GL002016 [Secundilactobacillus similis DSM 23365 = JCM 2765]